MKRVFYFILVFSFLVLTSSAAEAGLEASMPKFDTISGGASMSSLVNSVYDMSKKIDKASSQMMKIGSMLWCYTFHSESAEKSLFGIKIHLMNFSTFLSSILLLVLGFFMTVIASFYMFDVAFNLSVTISLLPLGLALWPFAWTRSKLKSVVSNIVYYVGIFIFLPLGILITQVLIVHIIQIYCGDNVDFMKAFQEDQSDIIDDVFSLFSLSFLGILFSYIVGIRLIPLLAQDFCTHFFGKAMLGSPMSEKMTQVIATTKKNTIGKLSKYTGDLAKHQTGNFIANRFSGGKGRFSRAMTRYGRNMAKTK